MSNHTKENTTPRESNEPHFVGIDVAKDELVVHVLPTNQQLTVPNSTEGIKELVKQLKEIEPKQIVLEATGGLERELLTNLVANGFATVVINPRQAIDKRLLRSWGLHRFVRTAARDRERGVSREGVPM